MSATFLSFTMLALILSHQPAQFSRYRSSAPRSVLPSPRIAVSYDWTTQEDAERERWKRNRERVQEKRKRAHEHWKRLDERAREQEKRDDEQGKRLDERAREQDKRDLEQWQRDLQ